MPASYHTMFLARNFTFKFKITIMKKWNKIWKYQEKTGEKSVEESSEPLSNGNIEIRPKLNFSQTEVHFGCLHVPWAAAVRF